jgi:hypothetical protein
MVKKLRLILFLGSAILWTAPTLPPACEIYFGPAAGGQAGGIDEGIDRFLRDTREQLVGALHELDVHWVTEKFCALAKSGIRIHLALEARYLEESPNSIYARRLKEAGVSVYPVQMPGGLMHQKFLISDRKRILTGSANFTLNCFYRNFNDLVRLEHPGLADVYRDAFYRLIDPWVRRRPSGFPRRFPLDGGGAVSAWFSPGDPPPSEAIIRELGEATQGVDFLIFAFSSSGISAAMSQALSRKVRVRGIFDDSFESELVWKNWKALPFQWLWRQGADVKFDGREAKVHHKCLVVDDRAVFTGSFNFSTGADLRNAENLLFLEHPAAAAIYRSRFRELWGRFPDRTAYETFIQDRKTARGSNIPFHRWRERAPVANAIPWVGRVEEIRASCRLWIHSSNRSAELGLAACSFPEHGESGLSQEPQASLSREWLARKCAMRLVSVEELPGRLAMIRLLPREPGGTSNASLNEEVLSAGWALHSEAAPGGLDAGCRSSLSNAANQALRERRGLMLAENHLPDSPEAFRLRLEKHRLERMARERDLALPAFESNACIADRRRGNFAEPGQAAWSERWRDLGSPELVCFKSAVEAKAAGYRRCRDE